MPPLEQQIREALAYWKPFHPRTFDQLVAIVLSFAKGETRADQQGT